MTTGITYFKQAELALAAYADLAYGTPDPQKLRDVDMSEAQAISFSASWSVAAQYTDPASGVSATVFEEIATGKKYLAIRGTQASGTDLTADGLLALGLPSNLNPQFTALKTQLDIWLADPIVLKDKSFTVSGHSLGGYLAAAVKQTYSQATDAYLFNAPGVSGPLGNLADALTSTLSLSGTPSANIWNLRGSEGFPIISGLGYQLGTAISIQTEATANPLNNHSIIGLTDALAVYAAFGTLDPTLNVEDILAIIKASTDQNAPTLEAALAALGDVFGKSFPQGETTRDALYTNIQTLQGDTLFVQSSGLVHVESLVDLKSYQLISLAQGDIAYRYALMNLDPFAITGDAALYAQHNSQG